MLNFCVVMGRMARDPELRRTGSGVAVVSFTVAVDRDFNPKDGGEKEVDFIDCVAWRGTAEFVSKYFFKGSMVIACGRLQIRNWTDKEGNKRRSAEVVADSVYFGDSKKSSEGNSLARPMTPQEIVEIQGFPETEAMLAKYSAPSEQNQFTMLEGEDLQLPF